MNFLTRNIKYIAIAVFAAVVIAVLWLSNGNKPHEESFFALDTQVSFKIYCDKKTADRAFKEARSFLENFENEISLYKEGGFACKFETLSKGEKLEMSENVQNLIEMSKGASEKTDGCFDITTAPLSKLWNVTGNTVPPEENEVLHALEKVGYKNLEVDGNFLVKTDASVDFGAIAKGYASDKIKEIFKSCKVSAGVINLGGNVTVFGKNPSKDSFAVGITDPTNPSDICAAVYVNEKSVITSGAYQRYFEHDGKIYHHILSPFDGYPADTDVASVTVISKDGALADALSTAAFVAGSEKGLIYIEDAGAQGLIVLKNGEIIASDGLQFEKR